jgi:chromosome segregation ATPase
LIVMSDSGHASKSLRERLGSHTEDRLGKALSDLLDNPLLTGAIGRAFDAREKATQAQEVAMGALNLPSAADMERLTRRLRSLSQRLEGIEDGVGRLDRALAPGASDRSDIDRRLSAIEQQLSALVSRLDAAPARVRKAAPARAKRATGTRASTPAPKGA